MTGVYMLTIGDKRYIGSSLDIERRIIQHKAALKAGRAPLKLQDAFDRNKKAEYTVLEIVPDTEIVWELEVRERKWIEELNPELNHYIPGNMLCSPDHEIEYALKYLQTQYKYISQIRKKSKQVKLLKSTASMLVHIAGLAEKRMTTIGEAKSKQGGK